MNKRTIVMAIGACVLMIAAFGTWHAQSRKQAALAARAVPAPNPFAGIERGSALRNRLTNDFKPNAKGVRSRVRRAPRETTASKRGAMQTSNRGGGEATASPEGAVMPAGQAATSLPEARAALALVGSDPEAEDVWTRAINDPNLDAGSRKDLIEDLNEDGFADPQNITPGELPLVVNRLRLIEQLAPDSMDQANADAFDEAYKDLTNIYDRLNGNENP